jgi:hypothetical protein
LCANSWRDANIQARASLDALRRAQGERELSLIHKKNYPFVLSPSKHVGTCAVGENRELTELAHKARGHE